MDFQTQMLESVSSFCYTLDTSKKIGNTSPIVDPWKAGFSEKKEKGKW